MIATLMVTMIASQDAQAYKDLLDSCGAGTHVRVSRCERHGTLRIKN
jgi:hypothetical protein